MDWQGIGVVAAGWLLAAIVGSLLVPPVLDCLEASMLRGWGRTIEAPSWIPKETWHHVWNRQGGGRYLGFLEVTILYAAFVTPDGWPLSAAWLAFKVACQWESWKHSAGMVTVTEELVKEAGCKSRETHASDLLAINRWVSLRYMSFLVGTAANIVIGLGVAALARSVAKVFSPSLFV